MGKKKTLFLTPNSSLKQEPQQRQLSAYVCVSVCVQNGPAESPSFSQALKKIWVVIQNPGYDL